LGLRVQCIADQMARHTSDLDKALEAVETVVYSPARNRAGGTEPTPQPLGYDVAFKHLDAIDDAR
jgi:hypothetical protein